MRSFETREMAMRPWNKARRKALLLHGFKLGNPDWHRVVWGVPRDDIYGRVPAALQAGWESGVEKIIFGGTEGRQIFAYTLQHLFEVSESSGICTTALRVWLERVAVFDDVTTRTSEEIEWAVTYCKQNGFETLFVVSSPSHKARCGRDSTLYLEYMDGVRVVNVHSDTGWGKPEETLVVEKPSNGSTLLWRVYHAILAYYEWLPRSFRDED
jgi:hypothetical protein